MNPSPALATAFALAAAALAGCAATPSGEHHAGDVPAIRADANGVATVNTRIAGTLLGSGAADIAGKALVVHAMPDDYTTQPTGNSGARIACGVIGVASGRDAAGNVVPIPKDL